MKKLKNITIISPGGNDTALIKGIVSKDERKQINDLVMSQYPTVEQVGFYEFEKEKNLATLEMAGGEFCGNATRSLAYLLLNKSDGSINIRVSGTTQVLQAGVRLGYSFAQIPLPIEQNLVKKLTKNMWQVTLEGIIHLIIYKKTTRIDAQYLKTYGMSLIRQTGLAFSEKAAGVMFVTEDFKLFPVVWVRDVQTLFLETSCESGTAAVALVKQFLDKSANTTLTLFQPSGLTITARITNQDTLYTEIYGTTAIV